MNVSIYILDDPTDTSLRMYIGKTVKKLSIRLSQHLNKRGLRVKTEKNSWIKSLLSREIIPRITLLEIVDKDSWQEAERFWISYFKSIGIRLVNGTEGGEGLSNPTVEVRKRMSNSLKGRSCWSAGLTKATEPRLRGNTTVRSLKTRAKLSTSHKGLKRSDSHCKSIAKATAGNRNPFFGKKHSEETKEKNRLAHLGRKLSPEAREKCRQAAKQYWENKHEKDSKRT